MEWAAKEGVVPLTAYPYSPETGDCQAAFDSRTVLFAGTQVVDLSKPDAILQVEWVGVTGLAGLGRTNRPALARWPSQPA